MQISFLGPISLFIVMVVEIKNRRTYASFESWDRDRQELEKRQQPLWKSCGELFLALVLTRQVLLTWYDHLYRENFPGE
jgi:membrane-anchored protein YejM (alkaline phosphatase superfamily)